MTKNVQIYLNLIIATMTYFAPDYGYCDVKPGASSCPSWIKLVAVEPEYAQPALKHNICPALFKALLGVESNWNHTALNPLTLDYGISQINYRTAEALKVDITRLRADRAYSIEQGARVVAYHQRLFKRKLGPNNWVCAYNQGYRAHPNKKACKSYIEKLVRFNY